MYGTLFLCGTPIGNLGDITLRELEVLKSCDLIAAEDTRNTLKLLNHFGIQKPLVSYYEHNKFQKGPELVNKLKEGIDSPCDRRRNAGHIRPGGGYGKALRP